MTAAVVRVLRVLTILILLACSALTVQVGAAEAQSYGYNPAPTSTTLPADVASLTAAGESMASVSSGTFLVAFRSLDATEDEAGLADEGETVYRVHGGGSNANGHSWTPVDPTTLENPRDALGLPDANSGEYLTTGKVLDWTGVVGRRALPLDGNAGGAPEYLFPDPEGQIQQTGTQPLNPPF